MDPAISTDTRIRIYGYRADVRQREAIIKHAQG
jgi:hypothetical protein